MPFLRVLISGWIIQRYLIQVLVGISTNSLMIDQREFCKIISTQPMIIRPVLKTIRNIVIRSIAFKGKNGISSWWPPDRSYGIHNGDEVSTLTGLIAV